MKARRAERCGWPYASSAKPAGNASPRRHAVASLPIAAALVAMSSRKGGSCPAGASNAIGLVPNSARLPNVGTSAGSRTLVSARPIRPSRTAMAA